MEYLADTVAIVRHLRGHPALGPQAAQILRDADAGEHHVYLSAITLMEVLYLSEAKRVDVRLDELIGHVSSSVNYEIVPVNSDIVLAAAEVDDVPELHMAHTKKPLARLTQVAFYKPRENDFCHRQTTVLII